MIKLSLLICSLESRTDSLMRLRNILLPQIFEYYDEGEYGKEYDIYRYVAKDIEIVICMDNKQMSVGEKRNLLLKLARAPRVTFIDDDDTVNPLYCDTLLQAIAKHPNADAINFHAAYYNNSKFDRVVKYSAGYGKDYQDRNFYYRLPNHLMCVKKELALQTRFKAVNFGEDADYALRLLPLIKQEVCIDTVLYNYMFNAQTSETQKRK